MDAPFGRPVGLLAARVPARVRRRPPVCRGGGAPGASRPAGARNKATPSRLPTRDLWTRRLRLRVLLRIRRRSPSMARFAVREAALARRSLTAIGRRMRSNEGCEAKPRSCCSLHHHGSHKAPRKAGWELAADFEGQHGDQTAGPQGAPWMGAPTEGAKDAPFGRTVGFLAARLPARVRRRPSGLSRRGCCSGCVLACRGEGAAPIAMPQAPHPAALADGPIRGVGSEMTDRLIAPSPTQLQAFLAGAFLVATFFTTATLAGAALTAVTAALTTV